MHESQWRSSINFSSLFVMNGVFHNPFIEFILMCSYFGLSQIGLKQYPTSTAIYKNLGEVIELTCKALHFILAKVSYWCVILPKLFKTAIYHYVFVDSTDGQYFLTCPVMLPFNWQTPFGYLIASLIQFAAAFAVLLSATAVLGFLVGSCWLFIDTIRDITTDLEYFNVNRSSGQSNRIMKMRFCKIIAFYSDAKQLSSNIAVSSNQNVFHTLNENNYLLFAD